MRSRRPLLTTTTPSNASGPFDARRNGFVLGEGSAVVVLEEAESAKRRGAPIYGEVAGFASRSNAFHMTGLRPDGREMAEPIRRSYSGFTRPDFLGGYV